MCANVVLIVITYFLEDCYTYNIGHQYQKLSCFTSSSMSLLLKPTACSMHYSCLIIFYTLLYSLRPYTSFGEVITV